MHSFVDEPSSAKEKNIVQPWTRGKNIEEQQQKLRIKILWHSSCHTWCDHPWTLLCHCWGVSRSLVSCLETEKRNVEAEAAGDGQISSASLWGNGAPHFKEHTISRYWNPHRCWLKKFNIPLVTISCYFAIKWLVSHILYPLVTNITNIVT